MPAPFAGLPLAKDIDDLDFADTAPMTIVRPAPEIAPLLALGTYLHAGAHAGYGLGRYSN